MIISKKTFTPTQQQMFVASFYCFLNFNEYNDYVINFDDVADLVEEITPDVF
jgi:hypothetical protein